jgi:hypothetical protein
MKTLEDMNIHELRTKRDEVWAELEAVEARMRELEPPIGWSSSIQRRRINNPDAPVPAERKLPSGGPPIAEQATAEPGPNAHPEGEDAP